MSEYCNNDREESINFPIELDPFPFKSSSTEFNNGTTPLLTENIEWSKLNESNKVKENKAENSEHINDGGNVICHLEI